MKISSKYLIHRTLAIIVVPLLILSTATGFFRANQKWYWEEGYRKKKSPSRISVEGALIPVSRIIQMVDSATAMKNTFDEISVKSENGHLYYNIVTSKKAKYLLEAQSGVIVSPISSRLASAFAEQYIREKAVVKSCELLQDYRARKTKEPKPVYKICFDNAVHSEIYLDYFNGEIVEDIDDNRTLGIWIIRLHDYDFFNSKQAISSFVGIGVLLVSLSGLWIYKIRRRLLK